ncbi:MAG: hypothetical protein IJ193_04725 [Bacilli bacterium]|nr:hypothetical protein [Bacilli bacterium]
MKKERIKTIVILLLFTILIGREYYNTYAKTEIRSYDFKMVLAMGGDVRTKMDSGFHMEADYIRVDLNTEAGNNYEVRLKYSPDLLKTTKTLVDKKGIKAKGKKTTLYFIPRNGKCPGKKSQCIIVPARKGISSQDKVVDSDGAIFGVEFRNPSYKGGRLKINGTLTYLNYD